MRFRLPRITDAKDHLITAVLLVLSLVLMVSRHQGGIENLRKVSITLFSYLEEPLSNIRVYRQALKTNTYLRKQNILLLDELSRLRAAGQQNRELRELLELKRETELQLYPVHIVGKELNEINNSITVDAGTNQGIQMGMPMVSADGLVGRVILTAPNYSQVMPFYNTLFRASAKLQQSGAYGIVSWNGESIHELVLNFVPQTVPVDTGEVVVTSGYSNQFPPDIPIGKVVQTQPERGKETQKIFVEPFVNLHSIAEGFIIKITPDTTIQNLNQEYQQQFE
ncbi:rod shape-determining protein MreC [Halalkalibaculum sp. DA3122]|uniref:rod shape-determining protein MreC n=1 Tax=Halalkalibaculum sp. DA3122 TaxID=3373607 RepID=UPI00375528F6